MNDQSWMWHLPILPDTRNAISSQGLAGGRLPPGSLAGPTTASCGLGVAHASRSASQAKAKPRMTIGTCGPTCFASPVPDGLLSSWESRLRQRLARIGSTECLLTWKVSATPAGRPLSLLRPSMRPTDGTACGLWPTPTTRDHKDTGNLNGSMVRRDGKNRADTVPRMAFLAMWRTPTTEDSADRTFARNSRGEPKLSSEAKFAERPDLWDRHGMVPTGLSATTEKPGALNPQFVCWLMGFPPEWDACAPTVMPSRRKLPPK